MTVIVVVAAEMIILPRHKKNKTEKVMLNIASPLDPFLI